MHNARFMVVPTLPDSAFVAVAADRLTEALCIEGERTVGRDNTIAWDGLRLQIPESPLRRHYVQAKVKVHTYPDGTLAVLHGPRVIGRYTAEGALVGAAPPAQVAPVATKKKAPVSSIVTPRSAPSRCGLEAFAPVSPPARRPTLTGPRREVKGLPCR